MPGANRASTTLDPVFQPARANQRRRLGHHMRPVKQHTPRSGVARQAVCQHVTRRPAQIHDRHEAGEIIGSRHRGRLGAMNAYHRLAEVRRLLRILRQELEIGMPKAFSIAAVPPVAIECGNSCHAFHAHCQRKSRASFSRHEYDARHPEAGSHLDELQGCGRLRLPSPPA